MAELSRKLRAANPGYNEGSEAFDELVDQKTAFSHGLLAEGSEPFGNLFELTAELVDVPLFQQAAGLFQGTDEFLD